MITIPKAIPPPILYKYYPPERIDVIENLEVYFSSPSKFNDTFDTYHLLPRRSDAKVKIGRAKLRTDMGVLCLTERADNHMMWVNYARNHTGFVLGFDSGSSFFEVDERKLRKVIYQNSPPLFDEADENGCFYKSPEWGHEEEWRCIRRFKKDERRGASIEWAMLKHVIFGHQIALWMISRIVQYSTLLINSEGGTMPMFFSSSPAHSEWRFTNNEEHLTMCEHCGGDGYVRVTPFKAV
jgi:Protein of unknown function (DUF2971)